jgi:hypothetical protein
MIKICPTKERMADELLVWWDWLSESIGPCGNFAQGVDEDFTFQGDWIITKGTFHFKEEQDATAFMLRFNIE